MTKKSRGFCNLDNPSGLERLRRGATPIAAAVLFSFAESALAPAMAWAQPDQRAAVQTHDEERSPSAGSAPKAEEAPSDANAFEARLAKFQETAKTLAASSSSPAPAALSPSALQLKDPAIRQQPSADKEKPTEPVLDQTLALPTGADKSGVTSKAISLPQGSGKIQGMGESFSAQLSTGIATFSVPFSLPHARGGAQPALGLSYSSSGGFGLAGVGWDVGVPFIARQTDRGLPNYAESSGFDVNQDRFVFNGGQELVLRMRPCRPGATVHNIFVRASRAHFCAFSGRRITTPGACRTRAG